MGYAKAHAAIEADTRHNQAVVTKIGMWGSPSDISALRSDKKRRETVTFDHSQEAEDAALLGITLPPE